MGPGELPFGGGACPDILHLVLQPDHSPQALTHTSLCLSAMDDVLRGRVECVSDLFSSQSGACDHLGMERGENEPFPGPGDWLLYLRRNFLA